MPAPTKVQLIGGHFQDAEGNVLNAGHLSMELVQDEQLSSNTGQVCGGIKITILLDSGGSVSTSPAQSVWPTDVMSPSGASYTVRGYTAQGELAWGPNYNLLVPTGATFDVDNWLPNSTGGGSGSGGSSIQLQVEGVNNAVQTLLNLESTDASVTITDEGNGSVNFQASGGSLPVGTTFYDYDGATSTTDIIFPDDHNNDVQLLPFVVQAGFSFTHLVVNISTSGAGGGGTADWGIYKLVTPTTATLVANVGKQSPGTGLADKTVLQGTVALTPGTYFLAVTGSDVTHTYAFTVNEGLKFGFFYASTTDSATGNLPAGITLTRSAVGLVSNYQKSVPVMLLYS